MEDTYCMIRHIRFRCDKVLVFSGDRDQCEEFIRANRFSVLLSGMERRDFGREVWAWRNEQPTTKGGNDEQRKL